MLYPTCRRSPLREASRAFQRSCLFAVVAIPTLVVAVVADDAEPPQVIRVEEDWVLDVAAPEPEANVPQVVCVFGPANAENDTCAVFEINHGTAPEFQAGGMQLQCWWRDLRLGYGNHPNNREFDAAVDHITFTTVTELRDHRLYLEIINGQSVNWGNFGGQGHLQLSLYSYRDNLNYYDPDNSLRQSRISYGKHRINLYGRTEIRYYTAAGLLKKDEDDAVVFAQNSNTGEEQDVSTAVTSQ